MEESQGGKACTKCKIWKPYLEFHKGNRKGGRRSQCVKCSLGYHHRVDIKNRKKLYDKEYCNNPSVKKKRKEWWQTDVGRACKLNDAHKRRLIYGFSDINTPFLVKKKRETSICLVCFLPIVSTDKVHLDHIIPIGVGGGHMKNNVRYIHASCNLKRPKNGSDELPTLIST